MLRTIKTCILWCTGPCAYHQVVIYPQSAQAASRTSPCISITVVLYVHLLSMILVYVSMPTGVYVVLFQRRTHICTENQSDEKGNGNTF